MFGFLLYDKDVLKVSATYHQSRSTYLWLYVTMCKTSLMHELESSQHILGDVSNVRFWEPNLSIPRQVTIPEIFHSNENVSRLDPPAVEVDEEARAQY